MRMNKTGFCIGVVVLLVAVTVVQAQLPEPLIQISFNGDWDSSGSAGADVGTVIDANGVHPVLGDGILTEGFDQRHGEFWEPGGAVVYGSTNPLTPTPVQNALSGLMSFTITGWFKVRGYGDPHGPMIFSATNASGGHAIAIDIDNWNRISLCVNGIWEQTQDDPPLHEVHWTINEESWCFFAVTYDGTFDPDLSDPWEDFNVIWYTGPINSILYHRPGVRNGWDFDAHLYAEAVETVDGLVYIGNTADNALRRGLDPNGDAAYVTDPEYAATFAGGLEMIRVYGSYTDNSGVLTMDQIGQIYDSILTADICGGSDIPYPIGDVSHDCKVDVIDLGMLAGSWLEDNRP